MASGLSNSNPVTWPDQCSRGATMGDYCERPSACLCKGVDVSFPLPAGQVQVKYTPSKPKTCPWAATRTVNVTDMASIKTTLGQLQSRVAELDRTPCPGACAQVTTLTPAPCPAMTTPPCAPCCTACPSAVRTIEWPGCRSSRFASGAAPRDAILSDMVSVQAKLGALQSRVQELDVRQCPARTHPCCTGANTLTPDPASGMVINWPRCQ